jgi:maleylpyruvate isomerase
MAVPEAVATLLPLLDDANERLLASIAGWGEDDVRQPSGLPGWTRAHVLAHLINNADGNRAAAWGAARELVLEVYPGGREQRDAEIEIRSRWPGPALVLQLRRAIEELRAAWAAMPDEAWRRTVYRSAGARQAWSALRTRVAEVELHHVDLNAGSKPLNWPGGFVDAYLPYVAEHVVERAKGAEGAWRLHRTDGAGAWELGLGELRGVVAGPGHELLGWLSGRADVDGLDISGAVDEAARLPALYPYG